ncbi:MAG: pyridoxal phosphate-dependent aminotransferase [Syntrophales bacterium]|jgi:aspartate aminotransferase
MTISKKINEFISQSSWIRRMFEEGVQLKKQFGADNICDFSLGNPNLEPPAELKAHLRDIAALDIPAMHGYMPNAGYPETRSAVAAYLVAEQGVPVSADHIVMTCGAGGALNVILKALLDPGDEVVIPSPFFVEYRFYVDNAGGVTKTVPTSEDFSLDMEAMSGAIGARTKIVLINSPNNPTGKVYDRRMLADLASLLEEKSKKFGKTIYLVSDEPYREIVYDGMTVPSVLAAYRESLVAYSYSKSLSIPGERIGYAAANPGLSHFNDIMGGLILCNRILGFVNAPALIQRVVACLQGMKVNVDVYKKKRDLLCDALSKFGYSFHRPEGAFYLFPRTPLEDDIAFVQALQKRRILTVPGRGFGAPGHFRIAYCVSDDTILRSIEGFGETIREFS